MKYTSISVSRNCTSRYLPKINKTIHGPQKYLNKKILVESFYPMAKNGKQPEYSSADQMLNNYVMFAPLNTILINDRNK